MIQGVVNPRHEAVVQREYGERLRQFVVEKRDEAEPYATPDRGNG